MHHHLEFKCDAAVTTTVYDVLLDDQMMTMYSSIYNNAGTKTGCEVAFVIVYNFFRKLASTLNTVVPALPGDAGGIEEQLSPAMINSLTQPHNLTVELAKRRMTSLKKRKTVARLDEDVQAAKKARQPVGLRSAAQDSDYDSLLLLTYVLHMVHSSCG